MRARLTVFYATLLALVLVAFSAGVLWVQHRFSRAQFDDELSTLETTIASALRAELAEKHDLKRAAAETREDFNIPNRTIAVLDISGKSIAAHWRGFPRATVPALNDRASISTTVYQGAMPWRVRLQREQSPDGPFVIFVAASEEPLVREQHLLARTLFIATPMAVLFAAFVCWSAAGRALSAAVASQQRFMADASHELRTPITAARTAAEVTLALPTRDEEEYRDALGVVAVQTRRLGRMVDDMLTLARADVGGYRLRLAPCALDRVLEECAETATLLANSRQVAIVTDITPNVHLHADGQLVRQLTLNLLDNAIKHTPEGGRVRLTLRVANDVAEIAVDDTGVGIPLSQRERIFERFVRLDEARETTGGAGLGLPIARWIAQMHRGTLQLLHSGPGGSQFVARLPL